MGQNISYLRTEIFVAHGILIPTILLFTYTLKIILLSSENNSHEYATFKNKVHKIDLYQAKDL